MGFGSCLAYGALHECIQVSIDVFWVRIELVSDSIYVMCLLDQRVLWFRCWVLFLERGI